jgi:hypothetical protein
MFRRRAHNRIELPIEELRRLYWDENLSSEEIAGRFDCDGLTIINRLRENGIPLKPRGWQRLVRHVPDDILETWPTPELAYVVGLIASDGSLQRRNNCVILTSTAEQIIHWGWLYYAPGLPCLQRKRQVWQDWMTDAKLAAARG